MNFRTHNKLMIKKNKYLVSIDESIYILDINEYTKEEKKLQNQMSIK